MKTLQINQARFQTAMLMLSFVLWCCLWWFVLDWPAQGWWTLLVSYFIADAGSYVLHYLIDFYGDGNHPGIVHVILPAKAHARHHQYPYASDIVRIHNLLKSSNRLSSRVYVSGSTRVCSKGRGRGVGIKNSP